MANFKEKDSVASIQQPPSKRAPPPSLTSLKSLNPYLIKTSSIESTPTLSPSTASLLTPPILNVPLSSPPPQLEGEDYLTRRPLSTHHKKRHHTRSRRVPSFLPSSKDKVQAINTKVDNGDLNGSGSESGDSKSATSDVTSITRSPARLDAAELLVRRKSIKPSLAPTTTRRSVIGDLTATSDVGFGTERNSAAVSSLRRMSTATKRFSVSKAQDLRRLSHALAATLHHAPVMEPRYDPNTSIEVVHVFASGISQTDVDDFLHKADTLALHRHNSVKQDPVDKGLVALETPTTITLRKASDAYFFVIGPKDEKIPTRYHNLPAIAQPSAPSQDPSVALVDFRSKSACEPRKSLWYSLPLLSEQNEPEKSEVTTSELAAPKPEEPKVKVSFPTINPPILPSDTALTFSSVHRTTPTCLLDPPIHRSSRSSPSKARKRTSTIHIHSRNSVHEVIWAEDENTNTSSSSSPESTSPTQKLSRRPSLLAGNVNPKTRSRSEPASPGPSEIPPRIALPEETIFDWSWNTPGPSSQDPQVLEDPMVCSPIEEVPPDPQRLGRKRPSISKDSSVESFPPLLERNNTTEWQRAPLVDINAPLGEEGKWMPVMGRMQERSETDPGTITQVRGLGEEAGDAKPEGMSDKSNGGDGAGGGERCIVRRASYHPYAEARMGEKGRVGSSVGISGRKRVSWTKV